MSDKPSALRPTDDEAIHLARQLVRSARFASLAVIEPDTGYPFASRVSLGTDIDGAPVTLVSELSNHTQGLTARPQCSILVGEPGHGDPLTWPRMTVRCHASRIEHASPHHRRIRGRFLRRHPKAGLYADFGDFSFFRLEPQSASLNGGFGKAYAIPGEVLKISSPVSEELADRSATIIQALASDERRNRDTSPNSDLLNNKAAWTLCNIDAGGFDLQNNDKIRRIEFSVTVTSIDEFISLYDYLLKKMP